MRTAAGQLHGSTAIHDSATPSYRTNTNGKTCAYPRDCQSADAARTDEMPFSVGNETGRVAAAVALQLQVDTARVVRPRAELHFAQLVVERKPRDVDLARAEEQAWRHPETVARRRHHHVRRERAVNVLVGAVRTTASHRQHAAEANNNSRLILNSKFLQ